MCCLQPKKMSCTRSFITHSLQKRSFLRFINITSLMSRNMASKSKPDHLERTADNMRENIVSLATVIGMRDESKTVKSLKVKVHDKRVTFKAGQWVDMFIPGVDKVGGFSMWSSPHQLVSEETLDLAIKYSDHPPAKWVHTECKVGTDVHVRVGGDVYFDPPPTQKDRDLLLIAGGIGINPILSILSHVANMKSKTDNSDEWVDNSGYSGRCHLLYSSSTMEELLFTDEILSTCEQFPEEVKCKFFATQEKETKFPDTIKYCRISEDDLLNVLNSLDKDKLLTYICGPPPMIHGLEDILIKLGLRKDQIMYEQWW